MSLLTPAIRSALELRWQETHRAYHTLQHLGECLDGLERARDAAERPEEIELALWFHDAIYDPRAPDNERRSAELATAMLTDAGLEPDTIDRVTAMILATTHARIADDPDTRLCCDIDLAILGASPARFEEYERQVRQEYDWVPAVLYRQRRSAILAALLARPHLYATTVLRERLEETARTNLARSLAQLRA